MRCRSASKATTDVSFESDTSELNGIFGVTGCVGQMIAACPWRRGVSRRDGAPTWCGRGRFVPGWSAGLVVGLGELGLPPVRVLAVRARARRGP